MTDLSSKPTDLNLGDPVLTGVGFILIVVVYTENTNCKHMNGSSVSHVDFHCSAFIVILKKNSTRKWLPHIGYQLLPYEMDTSLIAFHIALILLGNSGYVRKYYELGSWGETPRKQMLPRINVGSGAFIDQHLMRPSRRMLTEI